MVSNLALFFTGPPRCSLACSVSPPRLLPPDLPRRPTCLLLHHHHRRPLHRYATFSSDTRRSRDLADKTDRQRTRREKLSGCRCVELHVRFKTRHLTSSAGWQEARYCRELWKCANYNVMSAFGVSQACITVSPSLITRDHITCVKTFSVCSPGCVSLQHTCVCLQRQRDEPIAACG